MTPASNIIDRTKLFSAMQEETFLDRNQERIDNAVAVLKRLTATRDDAPYGDDLMPCDVRCGE